MYGPIREDGSRKIRSASDVLKKLLPGNNKGRHKIVYLRDSSFKFEDKLFYGTPWVTDLSRWAFNKEEKELEQEYLKIPYKCDVLLTHMPPNIYDMGTVLQHGCGFGIYGSDILANKLQERNIKYTFCGHVHSGNHHVEEYKDNCKVVNVSIKDEDYIVRTHYFEVYEI